MSKAKPVSEIEAVYELGHRDFGENRAQEMAEKAARLPEDIRWHFVGGLQTNKARLVTHHPSPPFDGPGVPRRGMGQGSGLPPPVLLQINTGHERQKSGVEPEEARSTLAEVLSVGLEVRGLMAIPLTEDAAAQRPHFAMLREIQSELAGEHPEITELSMGMTDDFEVAIEEGSSIIRVGRAIFGERT